MKRTLSYIIEVITKEAESKRTSAAYGGEWTDGGASRLESELSLFIEGFKACADHMISELNYIMDPESTIEVPDQWKKYFIKEDKEYQDYLRLKQKYDGK